MRPKCLHIAALVLLPLTALSYPFWQGFPLRSNVNWASWQILEDEFNISSQVWKSSWQRNQAGGQNSRGGGWWSNEYSWLMDIEYSNVVFSGAGWTNSTSNVYLIVTNAFISHYYDGTNEYEKAVWIPNAGFVTNVFYKSDNPLGDPITNYPYYSTGLGVSLHISFVERQSSYPERTVATYLPYEPFVEWLVADVDVDPPLLDRYFGSNSVTIVDSVTNAYYPPIPYQTLAGIWTRYDIGPAIDPVVQPNGFVGYTYDTDDIYATKEERAWWPITEEIGPSLELAELVWIPDIIVTNMIAYNGTYEWGEDVQRWTNIFGGNAVHVWGEVENWGDQAWYYIDELTTPVDPPPPELRGSRLNISNVWYCCGAGISTPPYSEDTNSPFWTGAGMVYFATNSGLWQFRNMQDLSDPDTNAPTFVGSTIGHPSAPPDSNVPRPSRPVAYISDSKIYPYGLGSNNLIQARYNAGVSNHYQAGAFAFPAGTFTVQGHVWSDNVTTNAIAAEWVQSLTDTNATDVETIVHGPSVIDTNLTETFEHVTNMYYSVNGSHGDSISFGYETNTFYLWQSVPERGLLMVENYDAYYNYMRALNWAAYSDIHQLTNYTAIAPANDCPETDAIATWEGWGWVEADASGPIFNGDGPDVPGAVVMYSDDPCHVYEVLPTDLVLSNYFKVHYTNECATSPYSAHWDFKYKIEAAGTVRICNPSATATELWWVQLGTPEEWTNTWVDGSGPSGLTLSAGTPSSATCVTRSWSVWKYAYANSGNQDVLRTLDGALTGYAGGAFYITNAVISSAAITYEEAWLFARRWAGAYFMHTPWHWREYNNPITNIFYEILSDEDFYIRSGDPSVGTPYEGLAQHMIFDNEGLNIRYDPTNMLAIYTYSGRTFGPDVGCHDGAGEPHIVPDYCMDLTDFPFYDSGKFSTKGWRGGVFVTNEPAPTNSWGESMWLIRYDVDGGFDQGRTSTGSVP